LLWGLCLVERGTSWEIPSVEPTALPRPYALLKLTMLPGRLEWSTSGDPVLRLNRPALGDTASGVSVRPEPAIPARLRAGDVQGACEVAVRRLRASGFQPLGGFGADGSRRVIDWSGGGVPPERLLAALLFPIPDKAANQLANLVLRRPSAESLT
jgi:CRISPR-associated protein Csx17